MLFWQTKAFSESESEDILGRHISQRFNQHQEPLGIKHLSSGSQRGETLNKTFKTLNKILNKTFKTLNKILNKTFKTLKKNI